MVAGVIATLLPASHWTLRVPATSEVDVVKLMGEVLDHVVMIVRTCTACGALMGLSTDHLGDPPQYLVVQPLCGQD